MLRRLVLIVTLLVPAVAHAQLLPADADAAAPSASATAPPAPTFAPAPTSTNDARAPRGPAMRERNAPPSRAAAMARGSLMLVALVVLVGYGVIKRIRRRM